MSTILGINETSHDASLSLIKDGNILFASHVEIYSKNKNDWYNNKDIYEEALSYGQPDLNDNLDYIKWGNLYGFEKNIGIWSNRYWLYQIIYV